MDLRFSMLLGCFFLSGFAALLYQTAWSRELAFVFGTSALAVAAILAAYMGGLALGAAVAARVARRLRRPVLLYGVLEGGIALSALAVPLGIAAVRALYTRWLGGAEGLGAAGTGVAAAVQLIGAFAVLLPPTAFMGATLPLLARGAVHRDEEIGSRIGVLYAVNTAGAIAGTLCAAFWLMPSFGLRWTVWFGAAVNAIVFVFAVLLSRAASPAFVDPSASPAAWARTPEGSAWVLPAIAVSGALSFSYEVMWTRLLGQLLGASTYAFATMLTGFLLGIALGSAVAARFASTRRGAARGFAFSQIGLALTAYGSFALADRLPALARWLGAGPSDLLASAVLAVVTLLPITLCIGATFPFAVRALSDSAENAAGATARVYAWNTLGAIAGSLGTGYFLLPILGFAGLATLGVVVSVGLALLAALAGARRRAAWTAFAALAIVFVAAAPPNTPRALLRSSPMTRGGGEVVHLSVGRTTTVMVIDWSTSRPYYQVLTDGLPEAFVDREGMVSEINVAQWLGALPALVRPDAREMLVVGLGGGVALERVPGSIEKIDVIELEPEVLDANRRIAEGRARDPLSDPRVSVHFGDARGSLQLTTRRYDAIVSQPSHPWTAGASHLYTKEFFDLVRSRLADGGVFVQWIGATFVDAELLRSLLAALAEAFPQVEVYQPRKHGLLFVASEEPIEGLAGARRALAASGDDFDDLAIHRLEDFASAWALDDAGVRAVVADAPANRDDHNLLAARASRLEQTLGDAEALRELLHPHDPLPGLAGLDLPALVRSLAHRGQLERATDVALAAEGLREEAALGWVELAKGRAARAARHFEQTLRLEPGDGDALDGWIASHFPEIVAGAPLSVGSFGPLGALRETLVAAWRAGETAPPDERVDRADRLAAIGPQDALFSAAARVRIDAAIALADPDRCGEALALADVVSLRGHHIEDGIRRARVALCAGDPEAAHASLQFHASLVTADAAGRRSAEWILAVARELGSERHDRLARLLQAKLRAAKPEAGSEGS